MSINLPCYHCGSKMVVLEVETYKRREFLHCLSCGRRRELKPIPSELYRLKRIEASRHNDRIFAVHNGGEPLLPGRRVK